MEDLELLKKRYELAYAEYRAEVLLGADRQKVFVSLNPIIAALASSARIEVASSALVLAALASMVGVLPVRLSHGRYQQTREVLLGIAKQIGSGEDWQTTGGMRESRGEPRWEWLRATSVIQALLWVYVAFDGATLALLWNGWLRQLLGLAAST